ncbi:hypothetical protein A6R68_23588, partial [Neotoma lepida]
VVLLMMPATGIKSIIFPQIACLYGYTTVFNIINGNASYLIPHLFQMKYPLNNFWLNRALPIIFLDKQEGLG